MTEIYHYTAGLSADQAEVMEILHKEILVLPGMVMKERYKLPFYYGRSWICYLNPVKKGGVELAFIRGNELSNPHGILELRGRKQIAGIIYRQSADIQLELVHDHLFEAIALDRAVPYRHPGKRGQQG